MPKESRVRPEDWAECRREWEGDVSVSYASIAARLLISKALVAKTAKAQGWNRGPDAIGAPLTKADLIFTGNPRHPGTRTPSPDGARPNSSPAASPTAPTTARVESTRTDLAERPVFANPTEELLWVESQVATRQDELVARFETELKALRVAVYGAARAAGTDKGLGMARIAKTLGEAFERQQKLDLQAEALRTRRELGALYGGGPRPCVIVVAQVAGAAFGAPDDDESIARSERIRHTVAAAREILRKNIGDAKGASEAVEKALDGLEWDGSGNLIERGVEDVTVRMIESAEPENDVE